MNTSLVTAYRTVVTWSSHNCIAIGIMKVFMVSKSNKDANFANCFANNFRNLQLAPCNCISLIISIYSVLVSGDNTSKNSDKCLITPTFTFLKL